MKSDRYTESGFDSAWDSYDEHTNTATEGTIRYYEKLSNLTEYKKMTAKENYFLPLDIACKGALNIAECIAPKLEQNLKWSNETWYIKLSEVRCLEYRRSFTTRRAIFTSSSRSRRQFLTQHPPHGLVVASP